MSSHSSQASQPSLRALLADLPPPAVEPTIGSFGLIQVVPVGAMRVQRHVVVELRYATERHVASHM